MNRVTVIIEQEHAGVQTRVETCSVFPDSDFTRDDVLDVCREALLKGAGYLCEELVAEPETP